MDYSFDDIEYATSPITFYNDKSECIVPGKPFAKQRPRATRRGRYTTVYTPKETINYENMVKYSYYEQNGEKKFDGPLKVNVDAVFPVPQSISNKKKEKMESGLIPHTKKPDCDNLAKSCLDALNDVAYNDDSQIIDLTIRKKYGKVPHVRIEIYEINQEEL